MAKKKKSQVAGLIAQYLRARATGKHCYQRSDRLMQQIAAAIRPGQAIELSGSGKRTRKAVLRDRFADGAAKGIVWTPCAARRWELEIIEP